MFCLSCFLLLLNVDYSSRHNAVLSITRKDNLIPKQEKTREQSCHRTQKKAKEKQINANAIICRQAERRPNRARAADSPQEHPP
jgi:hypothetical protein